MNNEVPKYKVGETVFATWAGGHVSKHIIKDVKLALHGFWYSWEEDPKSNSGNGTYEKYLSKYR